MANKWLDFLEEYPTNKLSNNELRQALKSLSKTTNQRLLRLERREMEGTVVQTLQSKLEEIETPGGMLTKTGRVATKDIGREQMIKTIGAMKNFLNKQTSTVAGVKEYKKEGQRIFGANFDMEDRDLSKLADALKFARQEENEKYHVDSGVVAIVNATRGQSRAKYYEKLRNYGYLKEDATRLRDREARRFFSEFRSMVDQA